METGDDANLMTPPNNNNAASVKIDDANTTHDDVTTPLNAEETGHEKNKGGALLEASGDIPANSGLNRNLVWSTFLVTFSSPFLMGWNLGVLNLPSVFINDFYNATFTERGNTGNSSSVEPPTQGQLVMLWSLTTSIFLPGAMVGAMLGGYLADKIGRRGAILASQAFTVVAAAVSSVCVVAKAPELLMTGRFLFGINSGMGVCLGPMFVSEISPIRLRGALSTVNQLCVCLGIFLSSLFGIRELLGTRDLWPYLSLLELVPALSCLALLPCLPDTPRYLLLVKQDKKRAIKALQFYRRHEDVDADIAEMESETRGIEVGSSGERYTLSMFCHSRSLLLPLLICCSVAAISQLSGMTAITFYSVSIFLGAGVAPSHVQYAVLAVNGCNIISTAVALPLMEVLGRRKLLLVPMSVMLLLLALMTASVNLQETLFWMNYVSVGCMVFYAICYTVGIGPSSLIIASELFRQGPRPIAMAVSGVCYWLSSFIVAMIFEPIQIAVGGYIFLMFLVLMASFLIFIYFLMPETKNKTIEEISLHFARKDTSHENKKLKTVQL